MSLLAYIHICLDPLLLRFADFAIHWYGVIMAVAVAVGALVFARQLERHGVDPGHTYGMLLLAVPMGVLGVQPRVFAKPLACRQV